MEGESGIVCSADEEEEEEEEKAEIFGEKLMEENGFLRLREFVGKTQVRVTERVEARLIY